MLFFSSENVTVLLFHPVQDPSHVNACRRVFRTETSSRLNIPGSSPGYSKLHQHQHQSCTTRSPHGTVWSRSGVGTGSDVSKVIQNPPNGVCASFPWLPASSRAAERIRPNIKAQQYHRETLNQNEVNQYGFNLPWYSKHISVNLN